MALPALQAAQRYADDARAKLSKVISVAPSTRHEFAVVALLAPRSHLAASSINGLIPFVAFPTAPWFGASHHTYFATGGEVYGLYAAPLALPSALRNLGFRGLIEMVEPVGRGYT